MTLKDIDLGGKRVLIRVDFNVPLGTDYKVLDDTRIRAALPTINYILEQGASVILMSHLGRPQKKKKSDGSIDIERFTLKHIVPTLGNALNKVVHFSAETIGNKVLETAQSLKSGEVLLLENTRFHKEEKKGDETFAKALASLADVYINDAFGTAHRAHASTATVAQFFDVAHKGVGFLIEKELKNAQQLTNNPEKPVTAIIGGAKVSDKILLLEKLLDTADNILIGGGMAYTLLKAQGGSIGKSLVEEDKLDVAKRFLQKAKDQNVRVVLPIDSAIASQFSKDATAQIAKSDAIEGDWMGLDIGPEATKAFQEILLESKTIFWNGPMGVFEFPNFAKGTKQVAEAVVEATKNGAFSLVGGGDSVSALQQLGKADEVSFVSTGGGAMLTLLEGSVLPGIEAISSALLV